MECRALKRTYLTYLLLGTVLIVAGLFFEGTTATLLSAGVVACLASSAVSYAAAEDLKTQGQRMKRLEEKLARDVGERPV